MSYSQKVKREVMAITGLSQLEMLGEVRTVITSKDGIKEDKIEIKFDNISMASRFYGLLQEITKLKIVIKYSISKNFGEHKIYNVSIPNQKGYKEFLQKLLGVTNSLILSNEHFLKGCVRGYFLYSGYVKSPEKEYAMDFFIDSSDGAQELYDLLLALDKKVFKTIKKNKNLVYLRNSEDIMDILVTVGSMQEFFKFEETTMMKDLKNKTIREMNWEVANETKTLNSANRQLKMIEYIEEEYGLGNLSPVLKEIAELRLKYTESSFQEIADLIGISKSGVKNRFRRLEDFYNEISQDEGKERK
ncbi:MAG: DNA-binding protein WhiA [Fusobacteriaceae bacterium]|nr:DNA-binding protein WhiA [Fusobacteriaceae bacterium]MBP6322864.1 DNA-binding protein WhiA [Fusobacteriaceae bacterium]MBP9510323.1 DNA-binding protein WhiA [Fusobacteriaceae bacterium]